MDDLTLVIIGIAIAAWSVSGFLYGLLRISRKISLRIGVMAPAAVAMVSAAMGLGPEFSFYIFWEPALGFVVFYVIGILSRRLCLLFLELLRQRLRSRI